MPIQLHFAKEKHRTHITSIVSHWNAHSRVDIEERTTHAHTYIYTFYRTTLIPARWVFVCCYFICSRTFCFVFIEFFSSIYALVICSHQSYVYSLSFTINWLRLIFHDYDRVIEENIRFRQPSHEYETWCPPCHQYFLSSLCSVFTECSVVSNSFARSLFVTRSSRWYDNLPKRLPICSQYIETEWCGKSATCIYALKQYISIENVSKQPNHRQG